MIGWIDDMSSWERDKFYHIILHSRGWSWGVVEEQGLTMLSADEDEGDKEMSRILLWMNLDKKWLDEGETRPQSSVLTMKILAELVS